MIALLLSLALAPLVGQAVSDPSTATPAAAPAVPVKPICRREVPTGSMMAKRTCHSRPEWAAIDAANGRGADDMRNARGNTGQ